MVRIESNFRIAVLVSIFCSSILVEILKANEKRPPNVVFFLVDDLGWRDLGCYGSSFYETPRCDLMASQGVRFTQAYAACSVCSPTRASILTGKYPARIGLSDWLPGRKNFAFQQLQNAETLQQLPDDETTLAETLQSVGYRTGLIGKWHLGDGPSDPSHHGFDFYLPRWTKGWPNAGYHAPYKLDGLDGPDGEYLTDRLTREAESFIEANRDKPFFLYLSHFAVHDPIQGRKDLVAKYQQKLTRASTASTPAFVLEGNPDATLALSTQDLQDRLGQAPWSGYRVLPNRTVKIKQVQDNVQFAAMVEAMDESLGRILDKLEELNLTNDTLVILFSDNGGMSAANFGNPLRVVSAAELDRAYSTSNLPLRGAKGWLYEGGIRVPLIVKWPRGGLSGAVCHEPVISTDFYPTILELLDLPQRPVQHADGVSLVPLLSGQQSLDREAIFWHFPHYSNHGTQSPGGAVRAGDFKLLEYYENGTTQLFNLKEDVGERHDLSDSQPQKVEELRKMHQAWRASVGAVMMERNPEFSKEPQP